MDCVLSLVNNPIEMFEETSRLLLKIADNILNDQDNPKIRVLQKSNNTIKKKILNVMGGAACLKAMGFEENGEYFRLPQNDTLRKLKLIRLEINNLKNGVTSGQKNTQQQIEEIANNNQSNKSTVKDACSENDTVKNENEPNIPSEKFERIQLPTYESIFTNLFLKQCEEFFHRALIYENAYLQERALSVIPLDKLEINAQNSLRQLQEKIKKEKLDSPEVNLQDFLILELLAWFKNDFFEWVDNPKCLKCSGKTNFAHMSNDKELLNFTTRVEMHKCDNCNELTPFPRYNDPNILLETRKGRCGEWANTFTLMCRAIGWDARYVMDQTDHVWTEVYSYSQKRWLHCDSCENVCDNPLMYESGWQKTISYVIAFSNEEIQDVTWRYTGHHQAVVLRRNKCSEKELIDAMFKLRENRQKNLSESRREYLTKRLLSEIIEMMIEKQPTEINKQGRTSGSLDWRLSRGEVGEKASPKYIWEFDTYDVSQKFISIQYSSALNEYQKSNSDGIKIVQSSWETGVFECEGIFRKVETDWHMVYLCRSESCNTGKITWKFKVTNLNYKFNSIEYSFEKAIFENGSVEAKIYCNGRNVILTQDLDKGVTDDFCGQDEISVTAILSGGKGDTAWQHAQLFREDCRESQFSLNLKFTFIKRS